MSGYHSNSADCVDAIGKRLGEVDLDPMKFSEVWEAFGVVVAALYRRRPVHPAPVESPPPSQLEPPPAQPSPTYSICPHCGFESVTANATKIHVKRMHTNPHPDRAKVAAANTHQPSKKELWERSHAPGLPYPGDA